MMSLLAAILLIGCGVWIYTLNERNTYLQQSLQRYSSLASQEELQESLTQEIQSRQQQASYFEEQCTLLETRIKELRKEVAYLDEEAEIQSFGFYESIYDFIIADDYKQQLNSVRQQQKTMIKNDLAVSCPVGWTVGDSKKEGEKLVKNFKKLILTIFNTECDEIIKGVKLGKIAVAQAKIEKRFISLNKSSQVIQCSITDDYLSLKIRELQLQYEFEIKRQEEREIALQIKKEKRDREEIENAEAEIRAAEEQERVYQQRIDEIQQQLKSTHQQQLAFTEAEKERLRLEVENLKFSLEEAQVAREAAEARSRKYKSGHIFVISNIGSFGKDVYRICLTTSADEDGYISNMNPVVPFPFDIHFKFFSEDVRETLKLLRDQFQDRRVNKVHPRRDFFRVSFDEIKEAIESVRKRTGALKNFTIEERTPDAFEYRKTHQQEQMKNPNQEASTA